jgi:hypothetical protein
MEKTITIDLKKIYNEISGDTAKIIIVEKYLLEVLNQAGEGNIIILTGAAPIWLYLKSGHALHGKAKKLLYSAPGQGIEEFEIFNHDPN